MGKDTVKNITLILLLGVAAFSMVKYVSELKSKYRLQDNLTQAQDQIAALAQERQSLLEGLRKERELKEQLELRNLKLKGYLRAGKNRIAGLFQENARIQSSLENTEFRLSVLKAENRALIDSHKRIYMENEEFKLKLSSVDQLKKAIKELMGIKRRNDGVKIEGNRGFLLKDGRSTCLEKVKIEVIPAQTKK